MAITAITSTYAQKKKKPYKFGSINQQEFNLNRYDRDTTANALFLYERGETTFHQTRNDIVIRTRYYAKVKIFNKEGIDHATIAIPIYRNNERSEKVKDIAGITHNGFQRTSLAKKNIYEQDINERWSEVRFTMPNIKDNSIIEYEYTLESPFKFNFKGWEFQSDIPKLYSEFYALVPGNYVYNRRLLGYYKLFKNESGIKKNCFSVTGIDGSADCEELTYGMKDIPAFIEEDYMTTKNNYLSKIKFELSEFKGFEGSRKRFTKSWKDVDNEFKGEKSIGRQLRKTDYIKKQLPVTLLHGTNDLQKAKNIYKHIKNHFTWNEENRVFSKVFVKKAFEAKVGNSTEINISLINALKAAGFDTELMLVSTRRHGLPTKIHPVMTDFNYVIAKLNLNGSSYLLDATDKQMPFAMLPYKTLNAYGRVMNFNKGSYWYDITPTDKTIRRTSFSLKLNDEGDFTGTLNTTNDGYRGLVKRKEYLSSSEDEYLEQIEKKNPDISILSYKNHNQSDLEKSFSEVFEVDIESSLKGETLFINPFLIERLTENPFKLNERNYPVDFGYSYLDTFTFQLEIPKNYSVKALPGNVGFKLPNNGGVYQFMISQKGNKISLLSRTKLSRAHFTPQEYPYLKEFFNQIIKTHKSLITLEKINP